MISSFGCSPATSLRIQPALQQLCQGNDCNMDSPYRMTAFCCASVVKSEMVHLQLAGAELS